MGSEARLGTRLAAPGSLLCGPILLLSKGRSCMAAQAPDLRKMIHAPGQVKVEQAQNHRFHELGRVLPASAPQASSQRRTYVILA